MSETHSRHPSLEVQEVIRRRSGNFGSGAGAMMAGAGGQAAAMMQAMASMSSMDAGAAGVGAMSDPMLEFEAKAEVMALISRRNQLEDLFKQIDKDSNEDLELDEFVEGLAAIQVELSDAEIEELFNYLDAEEEGSVDSSMFVQFFTRSWNARRLQYLQEAVSRKLKGHRKTHSNLVGAQGQEAAGVEDWDPYELGEEAAAMSAMMGSMVNVEAQKIEEENTIMTELKKHEEEDEDFCNEEKGDEWNTWEVASYLEKNGLGEYTKDFLQVGVDGSMFLYDMDEFQLMHECGVKKVHLAKVRRMAEELRVKCRTELDEDVIFVAQYIPPSQESHKYVVTELRKQVASLERTIEKMKQNFDAEIEEYKQEIKFLDDTINMAKKDGFLESEDSGGDHSDPELPDFDPSQFGVPEESPEPAIALGDADQEAMMADVQASLGLGGDPDEVISPSDTIHRLEPVMSGQPVDGEDPDEATSVLSGSGSVEEKGGPDDAPPPGPARLRAQTTVLVSDEHNLVSQPPRGQSATPAARRGGSGSGGGSSLSLHTRSASSLGQAQLGRGHRRQQSSLELRRRVHRRKRSTMGGKKTPPVGTKAWWKYLTKRAEDGKTFGREEYCHDWTAEEVAYWLRRVGFENYAAKFAEEKVTGEVLFNDLDTNVMTTDLGVKALHCGKLLRQIKKLKLAARSITLQLEYSDPMNMLIMCPPEMTTQGKLKELSVELDEIKTLREEENDRAQEEIAKLKDEVEGLEKQLTELEEKAAQELAQKLEEQKEQAEEEAEAAKLTTEDGQKAAIRAQWGKAISRMMDEVGKEADEDASFAKGENAKEWSYKEVCYWLELIDFPQYIPVFAEHHIGGDIVVQDLDKDILHEELQVRRFHTGKIMREIRRLKLMCRQIYEVSDFLDNTYEAQFSAKETIGKMTEAIKTLQKIGAEQKAQIEELTTRPQIEEHQMIVEKKEHEELVAEHQRLAEQVDRLEENLQEAQQAAMPAQDAAERAASEEKYIEQLNEQKDSNPDFAVERKVKEWNPEEVCWWLASVGYAEYVPSFREKKIVGDILLADVDADLMSRELFVKRIHIGKIQREIEELKNRAFGFLQESDFVDIEYVPETRAVDKFESFENDIQQLNEQLAETRAQLEDLTRNYQDLGVKKDETDAKLEETLTNLADKEQELETLKEESQRAIEDQAKEKIEELNNKVEELTTQFNEEKDQMTTDHDTKVEELNEELVKVRTELDETKGILDEKEKQLDETTTALNELEEKEKIRQEEEEANQQENSWFEELKKKAEEDITFGNPKKAHKWSVEEVALWLYRIRSKEYVDAFRENKVDGGMLLNDLTAEELTGEIGVKQYHLGKIMREMGKLREIAQPDLVQADYQDFYFLPDVPVKEELDNLRTEVSTQEAINQALILEIEKLKEDLDASDFVTPGGPKGPPRGGAGLAVPAAQKPMSLLDMSRAESVDEEKKADPDSSARVQELEDEVKRLEKAKVNMAVALNEQIEQLRLMIRVLVYEYEGTKGVTPLVGKDPVGQLLSMMGLEMKSAGAPNAGRRGRRG